MTTKFFRKHHCLVQTPNLGVSIYLLLLLLWPMALSAQNGITVSGLVVDAGTVTFNVSWDKNNVPAIWSDTVWVWVDYNTAGTMTRLPLSPGATLTATSASGVAKVMEVPGNNKGVWVVGNARSAGSFSATVRLLTATADVGAACAYASNYPPVGKYTSATDISFNGTPPYEVVLKNADGNIITQTVSSSLTMPTGYTVASFTDKTGAPGVLKCTSAALLSLSGANSPLRCSAGSVTLSVTAGGGTTTAMTYTWTVGGSTYITTTNSYTTASLSSSASYSVNAINVNNCESNTASGTITIAFPAGNGQPANACGCASGTTNCSGTCRTAANYTTLDGSCWGRCYKYRQLRDACGTVLNPTYEQVFGGFPDCYYYVCGQQNTVPGCTSTYTLCESSFMSQMRYQCACSLSY